MSCVDGNVSSVQAVPHDIIDAGVVVRVAMLLQRLPSHHSLQQSRSLLMTALRWNYSRLNWNELNCSWYGRLNPFKKNGL